MADRKPRSPRPPAPGEYFGLDVIASRLNCSKNTVLARRNRGELLMMRRRVGPRWKWYTNDELIRVSDVATCIGQRQHDLARRAGGLT